MNRWLAVTAIAAIATFVLVVGCKKKSGSASSSAAATTQEAAGQTVNLLIWSEYLPDEVKERFTKETGIKLEVDTYDDNETLLSKLQSGVADYDVIVPSDYMVGTLVRQKLIRPLDRSKLTNFGNLDPLLLDQPFDKGNKHSVPYLWGISALAYDKTKVPGTVDSWNVLFDERNRNQICMLDDTRECFAVALKRMGKGINETDPKVLAQAADMLKKQKALVKAYDSADFANKLASGDVWVAHGYTGQLAKAAREDGEKRFVVVIPKEGCVANIDNLCIAATSKRAAAAHRFIDFVLSAENAAAIVNGTGYAGANTAAKKFVKPEILNDPAVYPTPDVLKRCEFMRDLGEAMQTYDQLWTEIKGG
jgi:spermidine/putrescine-binding protein